MWTFVRRKPLGAAGGLVLAGMLALALLAEGVAPYGYDEADIFSRLKAPSEAHWLGTDNLGRDLLSRVIYGARVSMAVGFGGVVVGLLLGTAVGLVSGYFGGRLDLVLQRVVDAFMCFPLLLVALTIM
ncbi:MAG: ABC transporter permease, partial [Candidatus Rokubacteria bacterium]|nr:ABC transporter permease [Candidatus Rokubacteria bacterium]